MLAGWTKNWQTEWCSRSSDSSVSQETSEPSSQSKALLSLSVILKYVWLEPSGDIAKFSDVSGTCIITVSLPHVILLHSQIWGPLGIFLMHESASPVTVEMRTFHIMYGEYKLSKKLFWIMLSCTVSVVELNLNKLKTCLWHLIKFKLLSVRDIKMSKTCFLI